MGDAGGVDLSVAGVREECAFLVGLPGGGDAGSHRHCGEVEDVYVTSGAQADCVAHVAADLPGDEIPNRDPLRLPVHDHEIEHLGAGEHYNRSRLDLAGEGRIGAQQELLPRLSPGVEGPGHLRAAEGAVVQVSGVIPGEGHALGDALVDDVVAHLGEPPHIRLAGTEVAAFHGVVEEAIDAVAVVGVVLGRVDSALRRDAVGAAGAVLVAEGLHVVSQLAERRGGRGAGQPGPDHQDLVLPFVRGIHKLHVEAMLVPRFFDRSCRTFSVEYHLVPPIWSKNRRV